MRKSAPLTLGLAFLLWMGLAQARQSFVSEELENDAIRLEQNIGKDLGALATRPPPQLRKDAQQAIARKDFKAALNLSAAIVAANPKDAGAWLSYSRAALAAAGDDDHLQKTGTAAAYIAYEHAGAKPEQALALAWLGEIFAKRSMWRPSLDAYRANLDAADVAEVRNVYDDLREKHGFRILDYRIDNESCAILVIDNASGEIRAHVGAADYFSQERAGSIDMTEAIRSLGIEAFHLCARF